MKQEIIEAVSAYGLGVFYESARGEDAAIDGELERIEEYHQALEKVGKQDMSNDKVLLIQQRIIAFSLW